MWIRHGLLTFLHNYFRMKKILTAIVLVALGAFSASAQIKDGFGVIGGANYNKTVYQGRKPIARFGGLGGVTYRYMMPYGFAVQPSLVSNYKSAGSKYVLANTDVDKLYNAVGYLEVPVALSWGIETNGFRVSFSADPFVGYALHCTTEYVSTTTKKTMSNDWSGQNLARFEYGLGAGLGLEYGRMQLKLIYSWNFGSLCADSSKTSGETITMMNAYIYKGNSFKGAQLTFGFFF